MSARKKLFERIRNNPGDVRFKDLHNLLKHLGTECRTHGSHHVYTFKEIPDIRLTVVGSEHTKVKVPYVREAIQFIEEILEFKGEEL